MNTFVRSDGRPVRVVPGFRDHLLASRPSVTPRPHWTPAEYAHAADTKLERARRLVVEVGKRYDRLDGAAVLDGGGGHGINWLVVASPARRAGGFLNRAANPCFGPGGCQNRGFVDTRWATDRLSLEAFRRFVTASEGEAVAAKRCRRLETLNRLTLAQWRVVVEAGPFEVLEW